jgi:adenine/guanine phosphoribosyltransferase-like PRPP-binding protein
MPTTTITLRRRAAPKVCLSRAPSHSRQLFNPVTLPTIAEWVAKQARKAKVDALVVCGFSGLMVAPVACYLTGIPVIAARKQGERAVAFNAYEVQGVVAEGGARRWAWVDDFVDSGGTFARAASLAWRAKLVCYVVPAVMLLWRASLTQEEFRLNDEVARKFRDLHAPVEEQSIPVVAGGFQM